MKQQGSGSDNLLDKYNRGEATEEERRLVEHALNRLAASESNRPVDVPEDTFEKIWLRIAPATNAPTSNATIYLRPAIIAASIAALFLCIYFITFNKQESNFTAALKANNVVPGKIGATLTVGNGKPIRLSELNAGVINQQQGVRIVKSSQGTLTYEVSGAVGSDNQLNVLSTDKGQVYQVQLPDKSKVWLNAQSSLSYNSTLQQGGKRIVRLTGEGYFEVTKDSKHPFIVKTDKQEIEVLGTRFNVNTYQDRSITSTSLFEGSVKLTANEKHVVLKPSDQAILSKGDLKVLQQDLSTVLDWKEGYFKFDQERMSEIIKELNRWYGVEIIVSERFGNRKFTGKISRSRDLAHVLSFLQESNDVKINVEGRRIEIIEK